MRNQPDRKKRDPKLEPSPPVSMPLKSARKAPPFSKYLEDMGFNPDLVWISKQQEQSRKEQRQ